MRTCHEILEVLCDYVAGELSPRDEAAVAKHLVECPVCRAEAETVRAEEEILRMALGPEPGEGFVDGVLRRLRRPGRPDEGAPDDRA